MNRIIWLCSLLCFCTLVQAQEVETYWKQTNVFFEGVAWHPSGRILTVDYVGGRLYKLEDSSLVGLPGTFPNAAGGSFDSAGNFYFSSFALGNVYKVTPEDSISIYASGFAGPTGTFVDDAKQILYVANYNSNRISQVDMSTDTPAVSLFASSNLIDGPDGLALHPDGDLISANFDNNTLQRISPDGTVSLFATLLGSPNSGYLVRADSGFYVAGAHSHDLFWVNFAGEASHFSGSHSPGEYNGPLDSARYRFPNGMALSPTGDTLLVTETHAGGNIRFVTGLRTVEDTIPTDIVQILKPDALLIRPNPATEFLEMEWELEGSHMTQVHVLDIQGKSLDTLLRPEVRSGRIQIRYAIPDSLATGLYIIKLQIDQQVINRKVVLGK